MKTLVSVSLQQSSFFTMTYSLNKVSFYWLIPRSCRSTVTPVATQPTFRLLSAFLSEGSGPGRSLCQQLPPANLTSPSSHNTKAKRFTLTF